MMKHIVMDGPLKEIATAAIKVSTALNRSSSKWLKTAQNQCFFAYGLTLQILVYSKTRWNSMQMLFASLLRIRGALNMFAITHGMDPEFPTELEQLADQTFWAKLISVEALVRPLAAASFLMEKNSCTMAYCVHIYAVLFISYKDEPVCIAEVEKRWNALEHPLFMLAYLLHCMTRLFG